MHSITKQYNDIRAGFGQYTFVMGDSFKWSPANQTISSPNPVEQADLWDLLHEIAHGELKHAGYSLDVELVAHEAAAWEYALKVLAPQFSIIIDSAHVEDSLDTYREWLYKRSLCPDCSQTGLQTKNTYSCINCRCLWRANEARICGLRRIRLPNRSLTS